MTAKRFESDGWKITDNQKQEDIGMIGASNLLNELHEDLQMGMESSLEDMQDKQKQSDAIFELERENQALKKALWEAETEYIHERYYDNPIREEESINELKEDFKRGYWND